MVASQVFKKNLLTMLWNFPSNFERVHEVEFGSFFSKAASSPNSRKLLFTNPLTILMLYRIFTPPQA